jgi:hypothetical protein
MLSLILYGRNDSHGYNLHKRAAISLNAMAEMLSDPADEIIFVDYNTPDELPTFPETIADTLTDRARQYTRIIRVRPSFHRQFAGKTSLVALESQSRNIAIRRANPDNRWILSTNTDMIFIPQAAAATLSTICKDLGDGFYHLPRFEVPESFWERADRKNPREMIETLRLCGRRYHLNEVVYGGYDNVYEAPGDFQLFLRDDLFRIGGFDETMVRGWHVDTNTARRMKMLRGKVDTLFPLLSGYHCGHTRQATSLHGAKRTENNLDVYARNVKSAYWTQDHRGWGAPEDVFEELRLSQPRGPLFLKALDAAIEKEGPAWSEAIYNETTFCEEGFDAAHVLPHLGDIVFNMPPNQTIFIVGSDLELLTGFERFISSSPMEARLIACSDDDSPGENWPHEFMDLEEGLVAADAVVIQFPNARSVSKENRADLEWFAQHALERFIEIERARESSARRRVIVVNGIHSRLQDLMWETLDAAAIPYSARLRQGRVVDVHWQKHTLAVDSGADKQICKALNRSRTFAPLEMQKLEHILEGAAAGKHEIPDWQRLALEVIAISEDPDLLLNRFGLRQDQVAELSQLARFQVSQAASRCIAQPVSVGPRPNIPNRIASGADWEDEAWLKLGLRYFGERAYALTTRSRWLWERMALLHELEQRVTPVVRPWILVVGDGPDPLAAMAAHQGYRVAYATAARLIQGETTPSWNEAFQITNIVLPGSLVPLDKAPANARFSALLSPGSCLFSNEATRLDGVVLRAVPQMMSKAHFGASALVHLNGNRGGGALGWMDFRDAFAQDGVLQAAGLRSDQPVDAQIPLDTAVRYAFEDKDSDTAAGLSFGFDEDTIVSIGMLWGRFPENPRELEPIKDAGSAPRTKKIKARPVPTENEPSSSVYKSRTNLLKPQVEPVRPTEKKEQPKKSAPRKIPETAVSAEVATRHGAFARQCEKRVLSFSTLFPGLRRNLLPMVLPENQNGRSKLATTLSASADGRVRFAIPLADFGPGTCLLQVGIVDGPIRDAAATFVGKSGLVGGSISIDHNVISMRFDTSGIVGDGLAVFECKAPALLVNLVSATREMLTEAPIAH